MHPRSVTLSGVAAAVGNSYPRRMVDQSQAVREDGNDPIRRCATFVSGVSSHATRDDRRALPGQASV